MKLRTRIIAGFLAVAIIPTVLMSLLLFVYIDSSYENLNLQRSQMALRAFRFYVDSHLEEIEERANQLVNDRELVINIIDIDDRRQALQRWQQQRVQNGEFEFVLARSRITDEVVKAHSPDLRQLIEDYDYPPPLKQAQESASGLVRLGTGRRATVAAVAIVPIYHRGELVGELLVGRLLQSLLAGYQMELFGLAGQMLIADDNVVFASAEEEIAEAFVTIATLDLDDGMRQLDLGGKDYLISGWQVAGIAGGSVGTMKLVFDISDFRSSQSKLLRIFSFLLLGSVGFAVLVGLIYSRYLSKPLGEMSASARKIASGQVPDRVIYLHDDEIGDLVSGINKLTDDLRRTEKQLRQTEQVAAWQMFARQTAHELRNFLMPLATTAGQLQRWADSGQIDSTRLSHTVQEIHTEINRMKRLLSAFSDFAKMPAPKLRHTSATQLLENLKAAFPERARSGELHLVADNDLPPLNCDPDQIHQVLVNLVNNSFQAEATLVQIAVEAVDGLIRFRIIDDGKGVKPGADPFAPLYSTRENGSGLGLAISRRIIIDHGGEISQHDNPGGGAVFEFTLPKREK
jgi:signal transduction histidine kinase